MGEPLLVEREGVERTQGSDDVREGMMAFLEKCEPVFHRED